MKDTPKVEAPAYLANHFRVKQYKDGTLLTTDFGTYVFLLKSEYRKFLSGDIKKDDALYAKLEEKGLIITAKNQYDISKHLSEYYWHIANGTSLHILVPTLRCNHTCKYCYALRRPMDAKGFDMDIETARKTVDFIFQSHAERISIEFTGGEPLANFPILQETVKYSKQLNKKYKKIIDYSIVTNGTLFTEEIAQFVVKNKIGICLSIDGPAELHNKHRRYLDGKETFDDVMYWFNRFRDHYKYNDRLHALPVITKLTFPYWKELIDLYVSVGIRSLRLKFAGCFGFAQNSWEELGFTAEEFLDFWKKSVEYMIELNKQGIMIRDGLSTIMLQKILYGKNAGYAEMQIPCGAVLGQLVYDNKGDIYTCDESRVYEQFKVGNVKKTQYSEAVTCPVSRELINISTNLSLLCDSCPWYSFCGTCPVHSFATKKTLITKVHSDMRCKIYKGMFDYLFDKVVHEKDIEILKKWISIGGGS